MPKSADLILILTVLLLAVGGQVLSKFGALSPEGGLLGINGFNIFLALSYTFFLLRGALWSWVLRRHPVSKVYPFLSLAYPLVLVAGIVLFDEILSPGKIAGTVLIAAGSTILATGATGERN